MRERIAAATPKPVREVIRTGIRVSKRAEYLRARWPRPLGTRPPFGLAACAIFRDEARYLAEWVTFHRLQGVERFWLYDNLSEDHWRQALAPEIEAGLVTVTHWPEQPGQMSAYADCLARHRNEARWVAFLDIDEFLFSPTGSSLPQVLQRYKFDPGVCANWRLFGTGGHRQAPEGLVVENYLWRVRDARPVNRHVKSVVYPRHSRVGANPHTFRHDYGRTVGELGEPQSGAYRDPPTADVLRINHYATRSLDEARHKLTRPDAHLGEASRQRWIDRFLVDALDDIDGTPIPRDEVRDETMLRFVPVLREALRARLHHPQAATLVQPVDRKRST